MEPLVIQVEDAEGSFRTRAAFLRSPVRIGRGEECDLALPHPFVSGRHGLVQFDGEAAWYTDLGSRNGSVLDGAPLAAAAPASLAPGAELRIGPLRITFSRRRAAGRSTGGEAAETEAPSIAAGALTALMERLARTPDPGAGEAWAASLRPGLAVGRFELVREIGRGGFGVVWEARDRQLGRAVAFKAVRPDVGGGPGRRPPSLQREAEAAARLCHPNIVSLHDAGTWEGGPYLIMELLRGETLAARLLGGPLPLAEALRVAVDVARALAHAHGAGVLHRDLKPANVFLTTDGFAKVLDFGLAQVFGEERRVEGGTPRYMAPEQARGEPQDTRADVFAAAVVLAESLTGRVPGAEPKDGVPGVPAVLRGPIAAALAGSPDRRPADGAAWLAALLAAERQAGVELWGRP